MRQPRDVLRLVLGTTALAVLAAAAVGGRRVGALERNAFVLLNDLPHGVRGLLLSVMQLGSLAAVPVLAGLAGVARRPRLARDLAVAGAVAWTVARLVRSLVDRPGPAGLLSGVDVHLSGPAGGGFPSAHVAVAAALAAAAGPHLNLRPRRLAWLAVTTVAVARVYAGLSLPYDVVAGVALGWAVAAGVHLVWGSPGGRPTAEAVRRALDRVGIASEVVRPATLDARGSTPFLVRTAAGDDLFVKAVGRVQRDADVLFRAWRWLVYRHPADEFPFATPKQAVEHEAHLSMLAERAGARTPPVVVDTALPGGTMLLAQRLVRGRNLATVPADQLTDTLLVDLWDQVRRLHAARAAHRDLRLANVLIDESGRPWLIDFGAAEAGADDHRRAQDVAELLAATASVVGPHRACRAACDGLGAPAVAAALPLLQPLALTTETRQRVRRQPGLLGALRRVAAGTSGGSLPELERLPRLRPRTLFVVAALGVAVYALLPQVGRLSETVAAVGDASWGWMAVAAAVSGASYAAATVALAGAVGRPLPVVRTASVQLADSFVNRATQAGAGRVTLAVPYLERTGLGREAAAASVALVTSAGVAVHVVALALVLPLAGRAGAVTELLPSRDRVVAILATVAVVLAVAGAVLWSPRGRQLAGLVRDALAGLREAVGDPRRAAALFGGAAGVTLSYALALAASARAFGISLPLVTVTAVYLAGSAVAVAAPTPGGLGAIEAALAAGMIFAGAAVGPAIAAVLGYRLVTFWLPILSGWVAFRMLRAREEM